VEIISVGDGGTHQKTFEGSYVGESNRGTMKKKTTLLSFVSVQLITTVAEFQLEFLLYRFFSGFFSITKEEIYVLDEILN